MVKVFTIPLHLIHQFFVSLAPSVKSGSAHLFLILSHHDSVVPCYSDFASPFLRTRHPTPDTPPIILEIWPKLRKTARRRPVEEVSVIESALIATKPSRQPSAK